MPAPGKLKISAALVVGIATACGGLLGMALSWEWNDPTSRDLTIKARQYAYEPSVIHASAGDTLNVRLRSLDVVHGFYLEGHDIDAEIHPQQKTFLVRRPSQGRQWSETEELQIVVGGPGKYRFRCSHTCGTMHPFMLGELIVAPNLPLYAGMGSLTGLFMGMVMAGYMRRRIQTLGVSPKDGEGQENDA